MLILVIDTCFARCAALLFDSVNNSILSDEVQAMERGHAEALAPMVQRVMVKAKCGFDQLDRIAVTTGPGTFTGLRIGLSFAKALGLARSIPVVGLDTLHAVNLSFEKNQPVIIAHKAGQSGFFYVLQPEISTKMELLNLGELQGRLSHPSQVLVGTGADDIVAQSTAPTGARLPKHDLPDLMKLARYAAGQIQPIPSPSPVYMRQAHAKPQPTKKPILRQAFAEDMQALAKIHQTSFDHGWSQDDITAMLALPKTTALLVDHNAQPSAFMIIRQMFDEAEILTLATSPQQRRLGLASMLVAALPALAKRHDIKKIFLEVAISNTAAQALYLKHNFQKTGQRKAYYAKASGAAEDAVVMQWGPV